MIKIAVALLLFSISFSCTVQPAGIGSSLPEELTQQVDALFEPWNRATSPGMTVGVLHHGQFVYLRGFGSADLEEGRPNRAQTVFRIASTSKQFTAACIALLIERGNLSMETPLETWFPEFSDWAAGVELQHLIYHTSGIPDYLDLHRQDFFTPQESMEILRKRGKLRFEPGTQYEYSNSNYFLLAEIMTRASGIPFHEFAMQEIFEPLQMNNSHFHFDPQHQVKHGAHGYGKELFRGWVNWDTELAHIGDGGLFTNVLDLARWDENFYTLTVGDQAWLELMLKPSLNTYAFGLSIQEQTDLGPMIWHGGSWSGFNSEIIRFPDHHFSVIVLSNSDTVDATDLAIKVARKCTSWLKDSLAN
ncbi:MAG: hypothetical protein COA70_13720 [Planctomycetota bacterium]|nr:MAG: hypothetical protein COA70_13720 [Planctomycetota bacterium]